MNDQDYLHIVVNYTSSDQERLYIKEEDMVQPSTNHFHCLTVGDNDIRKWRLKSRARCPIYGSCDNCMKSGPVGRYFMDYHNKGHKSGYVILKKGRKILDSITVAKILKQCHESAKAWLYEEKKMHQCNLLTEYDCPPSYGKPSIVDRILDGVQFNLEMGASSPTVLHDKDNRTYKKLEKERVDWLEAFYKTDACIQMNNDVLNIARRSTRSEEEESNQVEGGEDETFVLKERARKTRKLTRGLREFTGVASEGERKCKGWSDEGMVAFENYVKTVRKDAEDGRYVTWDKAYRDVMVIMGHDQRSAEEALQKMRYEPNLAVVYEGFE